MSMLPQKEPGSRCLLVLGMHRSGTSATTRCLNLVGMDVGSHLLTPDEVNSKGYWEHADVVQINDTLLEAFGLHWYSLDPLPEDWRESDAALKAASEIENLVRRDFSALPLWGLKDPRMCRLAPLWIDVLQRMGIEVAAIFVLRSPLEVARSLKRAQGLAEPAGVIAWMQHLAESELATRQLRRSMINYDQLLADPVAALDRIGRDLELAWPILPSQREAAMLAFVDAGMRTHQNVAGSERLPLLARKMEAACRSLADGAREHDWSTLSTLSEEAVETARLLAYRSHTLLPDDIDRANASRQFQVERMFTTLYHAIDGEEFSEDRAVEQVVPPGRNQIELEMQAGPGIRYRLDPISHSGCYVFHSLRVLDRERRVLWDWKAAPDQVSVAGIEEIPRPSRHGGRLHCVDNDPQMHFLWPEGVVREGSIMVLDIERFDATRMNREFDALRSASARQQQELTSKLQALDLELKTVTAAFLDDYVNDVQQQLSGLIAASESLRQGQARQEIALRALLRRGLLSRLRRRLARTEFQLMPVQHLEVMDPADRRWRVTGNDPMFSCASSNFPLAPGWYQVSLEMQQHEGSPARPCLYPDYGPDVSQDSRALEIALAGQGATTHRGVVCFTHVVYGLRFDPATSPCELSVRRLVVRRISKLRAGLLLLSSARIAMRGPGRRPVGWRRMIERFRELGPRGMAEWLYASYAAQGSSASSYEAWVENYDSLTPHRIEQARAQSAGWAFKPLVSVLVPVYNTDEKWLRRCIESVQAQVYPRWELCLADDASPMPHVLRVIDEYARADKRIRVVRRPANGHISATSNSALALATGEYVALLDHDDELHPLALFEMVSALQSHRSWKLLYSDEDKIDLDGRRYDPYMKPDWNYDLLLSQNCISHFGVYQRQLVLDIGGFREGYEGSQDWDLALRCIERLKPDEIGHVPRVLYHWRAIPGSTAVAVDEKSYARTAGMRAVVEHLERMRINASVLEIEGRPGNFRVSYALPEPAPKISLIIPTRDGLHLLRRCIDSILTLTTYPDYEIVIVDNQSSEPDTLQYLSAVAVDPRVRVIAYDQPFNYSALNNHAVRQARGELIGLVNNDIEVISPDWLQEMAGHAMRPQIGAVGAMLYYPDDTIQHAGVVLGVHGVAAHAYCGKPRGYPGQMGRAKLVQGISAVTAACLLIRRAVFDEAGGLDESMRVAFNDIDFCLRVRQLGYRNLWTPFAELYHHESATRGHEDSPEKQARFAGEVESMLMKWPGELLADPAYSPNLTLTGTPFELAFPPRVGG